MLSLSALAFSILAGAAPTATLHANLSVSPCDVGEHQQFEVVTCDIELKNAGDKPIRISNGQAASEWDRIETDAVVPAHGSAYMKATVDLRDSVGYSKRSFRFTTDEPGVLAQRGASVTAFVSTVLDQGEPKVDFGAVDLQVEGVAEKSIGLTSREVGDFRVLGVLSKPDFIDASVGADGRTVRIALRKDAPWGLFHEKVKLKINAPQQSQAWITVNGNVQGEVGPDSNPFPLGLMRTNDRNEFLVRLSSRSGKDFRIGAVKLLGIKGSVAAAPCRPAQNGCGLIRLRVANDQTMGRVGGLIEVSLPEFKRVLPIQLEGMLLSPSVKVHDFNADMQKALESTDVVQSNAPLLEKPQGLDVAQAIKQKVKEVAQVAPPGTGPLLRWVVANEAAVYGYIIYRAESESGPFLRINKSIIRAVDSETGNSYQWRDNTAESGRVYWYSIGTVNADGEKTQLSGAQKVVAK